MILNCNQRAESHCFTRKSRSELTKIGIEKAKNNVSYKAINVYDLYKILYEISSKDEHLTAIDILDIIDQMPACAWV